MQVPAGAIRVRDLTPPSDPSLFPEVDEAAGVIRNVKLCGARSMNGRDYPDEVRDRAVRILEGAAVNLSHLMPGQTQRNFESRIGWATNVTNKPDGAYGDLRYNPEHPYAKTLVWWARNNPRGIGFSPDMIVRKVPEQDGRERVVEILAVMGIDLVADPSTTAGLTEAIEMDPLTTAPGEEGYESAVGKLVSAIMTDESLSKDEKKKKILLALKLMDDEGDISSEENNSGSSETGSQQEGLTVKQIVDAITAANKPIVDGLARVSESLQSRPATPASPVTTSVAREATEVPIVPAGPKKAPPLADFVTDVRAAGSW